MSSDFFKNFSMNACSYREECKSIRTLLQADAATYQSQHYWRALALQREQRIEELEARVDRADRIFFELAQNNESVSIARNAADEWEVTDNE